ncbi:putative NBD/HSP70 family sugar kinase [Pseudoclavibacter chungangensis]|uniref:ROK family transcriptional regulator n=1 Tax=Pseudoclavibacter chungangensis TaxID=587635 RepID=UPI0017F56ABE|nr:ROK family transcriptional regulator [Pseudoclavibacter chungangensis]NYJ68588.1 putative NBD/HSP70 family sugar kinase [Pseudoclavibacter chungangensis]
MASTRVAHSNLSFLLERLHREGRASRAELTRATGLNRSTISALVGELVARGLVEEGDPLATNLVGRPSPVVGPSRSIVALAVVPETDAVEVGIVSFTGELVRRIRFETDTPPTAKEAVKIVAALVEGMRDTFETLYRCVGIGIAVPGLVRKSDGFVRWVPHLGWREVPFAEQVAEVTGLPVLAANDANLGALAEHLFGAGRGIENMLYMNGGASGIGGGIIAGDRLLEGVAGYAGEFGHNLVATPSRYGEGGDDELEVVVSRRRLLDVLGLRGASRQEFEQRLRTSDDPAVRAEVLRQLAVLSVGVRNMVNILNPERVVLGGFLSTIFDLEREHFLELLRAHTLEPNYEEVEVVRAELGSDLLLIGAAELQFQALIERAQFETLVEA